MHPFLVNAEHVEALEEARALLLRLSEVADSVAPESPEHGELLDLLEHLDETFLVVVVGEVKSGKSSLVNTLLRTQVCAVGPTPVTDQINILRHGENGDERQSDPWTVERTVPSDRLKGLAIVDTPGTNSIVRRHEAITRGFLPRADLVLFVTSCDRPYSESENAFLHLIFDEWRRKIVFVLAKTDIKEPGEVEEIIEYVVDCCRDQLGFEPVVLPVSVKEAESSLESGDGRRLVGSGLPALEEFVLDRLDESEKTRLRLTGLVDASRAVLGRLRKAVKRTQEVLAEDHGALADVETQAEWKRAELKGGHHRYLTELDELFRTLEVRGQEFLRRRFRLRSVLGPTSRRKLKERFREEVVGDLSDRLVAVLEEAVVWLSEETVRFIHYALELFTFKVAPSHEHVQRLGGTSATFTANRQAALERARTRAEEHIRDFAPDRRGREMLRSAGKGLGLSAAGLGAGVLSAAIASLFVSAWWSVVAIPFLAAGWIVLGVRKGRAMRDWTARVDSLALDFRGTLTSEIERGIDQAMDGTRSIYEPYMAFYHEELAKSGAEGTRLDAIECDLDALGEKVRAVTG